MQQPLFKKPTNKNSSFIQESRENLPQQKPFNTLNSEKQEYQLNFDQLI